MLALYMIICIFAVAVLSGEVAKTFCLKISVKHKLDLALRSASAQLVGEELKNARLVIDEAAAARAFFDVLKTNLVLDDSLAPCAGSILTGPVRIVFFKVVNEDEVPFTYECGGCTETVDRTAVVGIISFPVKAGMFARLAGLPEESAMYCRVTVAPELISRPAGQI